MLRKFLLTSWLLGVVAASCTGAARNITAPPPPPPPDSQPDTTPKAPPGIAKVVLVTDTGTVFTGQVIPGQTLIAAVIDSAGDTVHDATISLATSSPGWTVHGDTVVAPTAEGVGTVTVTATRTDPSQASAPLTLTDVVNATAYSWNLRFGCRVLPGAGITDDSGRVVDSVIVDAPVDSLVVINQNVTPGVGVVGYAYISSGVTQYDTGGVVYQPTVPTLRFVIQVVPDTVSLVWNTFGSGTGNAVVAKPSTDTAAPFRYATWPSAGWCGATYLWATLDSLVVTGS